MKVYRRWLTCVINNIGSTTDSSSNNERYQLTVDSFGFSRRCLANWKTEVAMLWHLMSIRKQQFWYCSSFSDSMNKPRRHRSHTTMHHRNKRATIVIERTPMWEVVVKSTSMIRWSPTTVMFRKCAMTNSSNTMCACLPKSWSPERSDHQA